MLSSSQIGHCAWAQGKLHKHPAQPIPKTPSIKIAIQVKPSRGQQIHGVRPPASEGDGDGDGRWVVCPSTLSLLLCRWSLSLFKHVSNDPVACCCCCCCCYLSCFFFFLLYLYMHMPMSMPFSACTTLGLWWNRFTFPPYSACALHFWSVSLSWRGKPGMATLGNRLQPWLSSEGGGGTSVGSGGNLSSHPKTISGFLISSHVFWIFPFISLYSF